MQPFTLPHMKGRTIELRGMCNSDAAALLDIYGDPVVLRYTEEKPFANLQTVFLMLESVRDLLAAGESLEWAIVLKGSDVPIGTCGLHSFDELSGMAEVGCLLRQSAWGCGYMREAVDLLTNYARDVLGLGKLVADVHPDNRRAQRLLEKLGFRRDSREIWSIDLC